MGRQLGAIRVQGKLANVVGYKNPASSKANNNFYRERVYTVSNPKTQAQASQRAKARPAQIFYNAFERVLNHAFLPSLRASRNRNRFISLAMKLNEMPDLLRGEAFIPFCQYQISAGALGLDNITLAEKFESQPADHRFEWQQALQFPNLRIDETLEFEASETIGAVSEELIANTPGLVAGMELTFLAVVAPSDEPYRRVAQVISWVLDPSNTLTTLGDLYGDYIIFRRGYNNCVVMTSENHDLAILSAGLIISARSGNTFVYTNSKMTMSKIAADMLNNNEDAVISSYMGGSTSRSSELILQQASNKAPGNRVIPSSISQIDIELAEGVSGTLSSQKAGVVTMTNGDKRVLIANALGQICDYADGVATPVTITPAGGSARPLTLADTTFSGNGTITVADVQLAGLPVSVESEPSYSVTSVTLDSTPVEDGEVFASDCSGLPLTIIGTGLSSQVVSLRKATTGQEIQWDTETSTEYSVRNMPASDDIWLLVIGGSVYATFVTQA